MLNQREEWYRSVIAALLTVATSVSAIGQVQNRISSRNSEFGELKHLLRDNTGAPGFENRTNILNHNPNIDLSGVDNRIVRNLLTESVTASEQLYRSLTKDYQRYPEIRPLLTGLISTRAKASHIAQDLKDGYPLKQLLPEFQQLDSDWHLLSHRMAQTRGLSRESLDSIGRVDRLGRELEKIFQMEPQLDRRNLLLELSRLGSSVGNLVAELELDADHNNQVFELIVAARKLEQQTARVQDMLLDQHPYTEIVAEYSRFGRMWTAMMPPLQRISSRYVERSIRNIMASDTNVHNLLWLEQQTDRAHLTQVADALMRDVDEFFNRTPLKLLLHFHEVASVLETASDFYGTVQNFEDCVDRNEDEQTLLECYRYVEQYGQTFVQAFEPLRSQAGKVVLREIEDGILALRNELNLAGTVTSIDTRAMIPTAANLELLADHLDLDVRQWLSRNRQSYRTQALQASTRFVQRAQRIHRLLQSRPTGNELKQETSDLVEEWRTIYNYLGRCNTEHRQHLLTLSRDISEAIYNLREPLQL
ncbi:MAG: hypothetical protein GY758_04880 [Fuerstiella sp.]|nr:hypothetical protein [Fuerstiella sp.]MCP4506456.1 hypothetical protein [Fuerstiella sp.]